MLRIVFKFAFATAIVAWLLRSGKLDFSLVEKSMSSGYMWLVALMIIFTQDIVSAVRWKILLKTRSKEELPIGKVIKLTWIGLFFNSFLPGAVTGDLIKLVYARDMDKKLSKTFLITTVLVDRIIGLAGLLIILGICSVFYYSETIALGPRMEYLIHFNLLLFLGAITFVISLFMPKRIQKHILALSGKVPVLGNKITKTLNQVWTIGSDKKAVLKCVGLSIFLQICNITAFYVFSSPFYGSDIPFPYIATFIPLGFIAVAIPISPAGLGVGHMIFDELFSLAGIQGGASFFNLYFLGCVFINSLGLIPYLMSGKKNALEQSKDFDEEMV